MIKRCIVYLIMLTFLNLAIAPDFIFARSYKKGYTGAAQLDDHNDKAWGNALLIAGAVIVVGLIVYLLVKPKKSGYSPDKSEISNQTSANAEESNMSDKLLTPSGNLVVVQW